MNENARKLVITVDNDFKNLSFLIIIAIGLLFNFFLGNDYISVVCLITSCIYLITCRQEHVLNSYVFLILLARIFVFNQYNTFIFVCLAFIARSILSNIRSLRMIPLVILYFITHFWTTDLHSLSIGTFISPIIFVSFIFVCINFRSENRERCINSFLMGFVCSSVIGCFKTVTRLGTVFSYYEHSLLSSIFRYSGLNSDCNYYAILAIICLIIVLFDYNYRTRPVSLKIITLGCSIVFGLMTISKSFVISFIIIMITFLFARNRNKIMYLAIGIIGILLGYLFFKVQINDILSSIIFRFNAISNFDSLTTNRSVRWGDYLELIMSSPKSLLFGNGIGITVYESDAHNTVLQLISYYGLLGFLVDILFIITGIKQLHREEFHFNIQNMLLVVVFIGHIFFLSTYHFEQLTTCIFIIAIVTSDPSLLKLHSGDD